MNKQTQVRSNVVVLKQLLSLIPRGMVNRHARETGVDAKARTFSVMSHLCAMVFAQLSHAVGLNDVCDFLRIKAAALLNPAKFCHDGPQRMGRSASKRRPKVGGARSSCHPVVMLPASPT